MKAACLMAAVVLAGLVAASCAPPATSVMSEKERSAYRQALIHWRAERRQRLQAPGGWLRLAGLFWLREGKNTVGSGAEVDIRLPERAPARLGVLQLTGDRVLFRAAPDVAARHQGQPVRELPLASDAEGRRRPDRVVVGDFTLLVIERGGRLALRVFDDQAPALLEFRGLEYFPIDERYRVEARLEPYPQPRKVPFKTVIGTTVEATIPGELLFELAGRQYRLLPMAEPGEDQLFIVFADRTNGRETYAGGRFLAAEWSGRADRPVVLDFNKAYNPPCAFSPYATCPVPRRENRLPVEIRAGEKAYRHRSGRH